MSTIWFIRKRLFRLSQGEFAKLARSSQPVVSGWENGKGEPSLAHLARIRAAAVDLGLPWRDEWFFEPPEVEPVRKPVSPPHWSSVLAA